MTSNGSFLCIWLFDVLKYKNLSQVSACCYENGRKTLFASVQPVCFEGVGTGSAMENPDWTQREKLLPCTRILGSAADSSNLEAELLHPFEIVLE